MTRGNAGRNVKSATLQKFLRDETKILLVALSLSFESDVPIVVQHTRLDSRHAEVALLSTVAYAES